MLDEVYRLTGGDFTSREKIPKDEELKKEITELIKQVDRGGVVMDVVIADMNKLIDNYEGTKLLKRVEAMNEYGACVGGAIAN